MLNASQILQIKYSEMCQEIVKKLNDKLILLESNRVSYFDKQLNKIGEAKKKKKEYLSVILKELEETQIKINRISLIKIVYLGEISIKDNQFTTAITKIDSEYQLIYWKKFNDFQLVTDVFYYQKPTPLPTANTAEPVKDVEMKVALESQRTSINQSNFTLNKRNLLYM
jgi:hypothetical protein